MIIKFKLFEKLTSEEMLKKPSIQSGLKRDFGGDAEFWVDNYHSKTDNHKDDYYYRVDGAGEGYAGVGNGLYLGKDKAAIENFYNMEGELELHTYIGNDIKWLDLMDNDDFKSFEEEHGKFLNSDKIGDIVIGMGYDGIVYYDYNATGEEFVLFNTEKVKRV